MRRILLRASAAFALGLGLAALPTTAGNVRADDPKSTKEKDPSPATTKDPAPQAPRFPGYVYVTDVVGEVVKANDQQVTLRITWYEAKTSNNRSSRPSLYRNNRNFRNPFAVNMNRPKQVTVVERHHDYDLAYLPESLVRIKKLPPKYDENGKKVPYTQKEYDELRAPATVTGYASDRLAVVPGTYLEAILICDKTVAAQKITDKDLRIKYAIIWGTDPNPPKDIANPSTSSKTPKKN